MLGLPRLICPFGRPEEDFTVWGVRGHSNDMTSPPEPGESNALYDSEFIIAAPPLFFNTYGAKNLSEYLPLECG